MLSESFQDCHSPLPVPDCNLVLTGHFVGADSQSVMPHGVQGEEEGKRVWGMSTAYGMGLAACRATGGFNQQHV